MLHSPAKPKKPLFALAFLAVIIVAANSLEATQAAGNIRQADAVATSPSIYSPRINQPNSLQADSLAASILNLKQPQLHPSPATPVESYIFKPQPNGVITALKASNGAVAFTSSDLSVLLNQMPINANVTLKSGTYNMRSQYNPKDDQRIIGESRSNVMIIGYKTKTDYALIVGSVSNLELADFTFNVNNINPKATQTPNCGLGVLLQGSNNRIHDVTLCNAYLQGIVMGMYGSSTRSNCDVVENCEVYGCGNDGIVLDYCSGGQIRNCYIHDSYGPVAGGVNVAYGSLSCTVRDCVARNTAYGFATDNSLGAPEDSITFLHNTSNAAYINGFMVDGGTNVAFQDNTATNYAQYGFTSFANPLNGDTSSAVSYIGNVATTAGNSQAMGYCLTKGRDFTFTGNQAQGNLVGLEVQYMMGKANIDGCMFSRNNAHDVMVVNNPAYTSISNCKMGSSAPIWVDQASAPYTTIKNCL